MKVIIYSKEGCEYCDHAKTLCESENFDHEKIMVDKEELKKVCGGSASTYPQIFINEKHIGSYFDFQDYIEEEYEPILAPTLNRFTVFPLKYPELWELYKKAQMSNWTAEEVDLSKDLDDWKTLNDNEQKFIKYILAFFAGSDGIVFENINNNFADEVQISEARSFYAYQCHNEMVHGETYSKLIDKYIKENPNVELGYFGKNPNLTQLSYEIQSVMGVNQPYDIWQSTTLYDHACRDITVFRARIIIVPIDDIPESQVGSFCASVGLVYVGLSEDGLLHVYRRSA